MGSPTPTPWKAKFTEDGGYDCMTDAFFIMNEAGTRIVAELDCRHTAGHKEEAASDAALIVKAVNNHKRLLIELEACRIYIEEAIKMASDLRSPTTAMRDRLRSVNEAIALAEGSTPDVPAEKK